ncbi:MAG: Ig-like domain-containing protein [Lachnospiraceae bacterium]|nr:Ig-like domain-containing protein [Lachnospiraceae bacterium]
MRLMRKKGHRILTAALAAVLLFGCSAGAAEEILIEPEEIVQPEGSSAKAGNSLEAGNISSDNLSIDEAEIVVLPQSGENPVRSDEPQDDVNRDILSDTQAGTVSEAVELQDGEGISGEVPDVGNGEMMEPQTNGDTETPSEPQTNGDAETSSEQQNGSKMETDFQTLEQGEPEAEGSLSVESFTEAITEEEQESDAGEGLILEIEELEEGDVPEFETEELQIEELEASVEDTEMVTLVNSGNAADASLSMLRAYSISQYETCYGEQLDGESRLIYDAMVAAWASGGTGNIEYPFRESLTFQAEGTIVNGTAQWDKNKCVEYQELLDELRCVVQSAFDAFVYDYPEAFWLSNISFSYSISWQTILGMPGKLEGKITGMSIVGNERYSGAKSETAAFQSAVTAAVNQINGSLPSGAGTYDKVRAIHDYICNVATYGNGSYAYTPAGIFLKDKIVVCEGYAKSLKILCGRFGIPSAIIVGRALKKKNGDLNKNDDTSKHMWNYVKMEDGVWYLVDTTWDDQKGGIITDYFLAGAGSRGFYAVISAERQIYTNFSGMNGTQNFAVPTLSQTEYQRSSHVCQWQEISRTVPTCQKNGTVEYKCTDCDRTKTEYLPAVTHSWGKYSYNGDATCTKNGTKTAKCKFGCGTTNTVADPKYPKGHSYSSKWTIDKAATCLAAGSKSHHCTVCGAKKDVTKIKKLTPTIKLSETKVVLTIGKAGKTIKVSKLGKGDKVKSWKSSNTSVAKVSSKGKITPQKKTGKATITVTLASGLKKKISVTVQKDPTKTTKITGVSKTLTLKKGKTKTLKPILTPKTSKEKVTYSSSNKKVATVSSKGKITAKKKGTAVITVKSGKISVKCKVVVK